MPSPYIDRRESSYVAPPGVTSADDESFLDGAHCVFVALSRGGELLQLNGFGAKLLGVSEKAVLGESWFDSFLPLSHRDQSFRMYRLFMSEMGPGRSTYRYPVITSDGGRREMLWFHTVIVGASGERRSSLLMGQLERDSWSKHLSVSLAESHGPSDRTYLLSPKEREVAEQIRMGRTSREISEELHISRLTVDRHRNNMRRKLRVPHELRLGDYLKLYL